MIRTEEDEEIKGPILTRSFQGHDGRILAMHVTSGMLGNVIVTSSLDRTVKVMLGKTKAPHVMHGIELFPPNHVRSGAATR